MVGSVTQALVIPSLANVGSGLISIVNVALAGAAASTARVQTTTSRSEASPDATPRNERAAQAGAETPRMPAVTKMKDSRAIRESVLKNGGRMCRDLHA